MGSIGGSYPVPHTTARMAISQLGAETQIQTGVEAVNASGLFEAVTTHNFAHENLHIFYI